MVKEKFRDWNLLHKGVVAAVAAFAIGTAVHAVRVIHAAFPFEDSRVLPYAAETIWPLLTDNQSRVRWQAELIDISRLTGDPDQVGSTRFIFWKRGYKRWQAVEQTQEIVENRLMATIQEADSDVRWFRVELIPEGPCQTKVVIQDTIQPFTYTDRFWMFRDASARERRLSVSLDSLDYWLKKSAPVCDGAAGTGASATDAPGGAD